MKGECKGKADVVVRLGCDQDESEVFSKLKKTGLIYREKTKAAGRKYGYADLSATTWKDTRHEIDTRRKCGRASADVAPAI